MQPEAERDYVEYVSARLPRLHHAAYLLCGDAHRADDIVQAALTALYLSWRRARAADDLDAYVHKILIHKFVDERRSRWSRVVLRSAWVDSALPEAPGVEERDEIENALRRLPPGRRSVLVLRYFCDLSVEATAEALGCSVGTVKSQTARGLAALREVLGNSESMVGQREMR
ncbi:SigE family RNA polymerase sigma factor [Rugosimonospora acidiphila]|uniref:SigE family RNA polymerase sigma factor n=1 Tax=Rugosimonospora acidiphila TaxID=556531 RepID=A0ABP9RWF5_9ACTN